MGFLHSPQIHFNYTHGLAMGHIQGYGCIGRTATSHAYHFHTHGWIVKAHVNKACNLCNA